MRDWLAPGGAFWPLLAAPFVGSFLGVLIVRIPAGRGFAAGRSACDGCGHTLSVRDLIPLLSFLALRGRCRFCGGRIARVHVWIELLALGVAAWAASIGISGGELWASCGLGWALLTVAWIDAASLRLPDGLTLPLIAAGLAEAWVFEPEHMTARAFGAALAYSFLWGLAWVFRRLRKIDGLGLGDAKLLAAGGAWVGAAAVPDVLLVSAGAALVWALRRGRVDRAEKIPFGPFLAAGIWLVWLYS